jgi:hypothetical protein
VLEARHRNAKAIADAPFTHMLERYQREVSPAKGGGKKEISQGMRPWRALRKSGKRSRSSPVDKGIGAHEGKGIDCGEYCLVFSIGACSNPRILTSIFRRSASSPGRRGAGQRRWAG